MSGVAHVWPWAMKIVSKHSGGGGHCLSYEYHSYY